MKKSNNKFWRLSPAVRTLIGALALGAALTAGFAACSDDSDDDGDSALIGAWSAEQIPEDDDYSMIIFTNGGVFIGIDWEDKDTTERTYTATGTDSGTIGINLGDEPVTGTWNVNGTTLTLIIEGEDHERTYKKTKVVWYTNPAELVGKWEMQDDDDDDETELEFKNNEVTLTKDGEKQGQFDYTATNSGTITITLSTNDVLTVTWYVISIENETKNLILNIEKEGEKTGNIYTKKAE